MPSANIDYLAINKATWDARTSTHVESQFYDVAGFLSGKSSLNAIELEQVGDVNGKRLLHLQCHFGLDTLSWARLGATVTGVDLSSAAIEQAQQLAQRTQLSAEFICADVYEFHRSNTQVFDIVYTSYGAICWLPELDRWARTVADSLVIGGRFTMVEFHPIYDFVSGYTYFHDAEPDVEDEVTYTENASTETSTVVTWAHPLSAVFNALIKAGITIESFHEYPYSPYNCFPNLQKRANGHFVLPATSGQLTPLIYSLSGTKKRP